MIERRFQFLRFAAAQAPNRVYWLLATLLAILGLVAVQNQLDEQHMHALAGQFIDTHVSPVGLLHQWRVGQPDRWRWAVAEVVADTLCFVPLYLLTLTIWCYFYVNNSLFVANAYRPGVRRFMRGLGFAIIAGLWVGALADLLENGVLLGWLFGQFGQVSAGLMRWLRLAKLLGSSGGIFYILLHPVGLVLALRDAFFRLVNPRRYERSNQAHDRHQLLTITNEYRQARRELNAALAASKQVPVPLKGAGYVPVLLRAFFNVQFVVYLLLVMAAAFISLNQFDELLYSLLTEPRRGGVVLLTTVLLLGLWGGMVYVCSKVLLFIQPTHFGDFDNLDVAETADVLKGSEPQLQFLRNVPLWLSQGPFIVMLVTLGVDLVRLLRVDSFRRLSDATLRPADMYLRYGLIVLLILSGWALFSTLIRRLDRNFEGSDLVLFKSSTPIRDYAVLLDQAPRSILFGQSVLVAAIMLFIPTYPGLHLSQTSGLYAVVLLWLAAVAYLGTILFQFNDPFRFPVLLMLIVLVAVFSGFNDNTAIRRSPSDASPPPISLAAQRPDIGEYYQRWLVSRGAFRAPRTPADTVVPVVVVATAGGGIRAAAWTTECLLALNEAMPRFNQHLFAISGVSGGGVGAATYVATLAGHRESPTASSAHLRGPLQHVITEDLISPTAASMLFRGGINNFIPLPINALDRNRWLEDAWENQMLSDEVALDSATKLNLPTSFLGFWPTRADLPNRPLDLPVLLLNGAVPETGQKVIMTNLALGNPNDRTNPFYDVADLFASVGHDVPYKTATFLCARFPFVTSGGKAIGRLPNNSDTLSASSGYHVIDGGYAENTGILTAVQLIKALQRAQQRMRPIRQVAYYLVFLPNSEASDQKSPVGAFRFLSEPLKGFLKTWDRNSIALDQLIGRTLDRNALSFDYTSLTLNTSNHLYPLGWFISRGAVSTMTRQVRADISQQLANRNTILSRLSQQLGPARQPAYGSDKINSPDRK